MILWLSDSLQFTSIADGQTFSETSQRIWMRQLGGSDGNNGRKSAFDPVGKVRNESNTGQ
jgi:hypothetical protein